MWLSHSLVPAGEYAELEEDCVREPTTELSVAPLRDECDLVEPSVGRRPSCGLDADSVSRHGD